MRTAIIKGLIPIFVFLAFADGTAVGLQFGASGGFLILLIINWNCLRKKFFFDWALLASFLIFLTIDCFSSSFFFKNNLIIAYLFFALIAFLSLSLKHPFVLDHVTTKTEPIFWRSPSLKIISDRLAKAWGYIFLLCAVSVLIFNLGIGNKLWLIEIIPTALIVIGLILIVITPDSLYRKIIKLGGVASLPNISDIKSLAFDDVTIGYRWIGKGRPIILLHSFMMNMHCWDTSFIKRLSQKYRVFLFDYPETGCSLGSHFELNARSAADLVKEIITRLNLNPIAIIGYAMGGYIAQAFAKYYPRLFDSMILISADAGGINSGAHFQQFSDFANLYLKEPSLEDLEKGLKLIFPDDVLARVSPCLLNQLMAASFEGESTKQALVQEMSFIEYWNQMPQPWDLSGYHSPVLIFSGKKDVLIPFENFRLLHKHLKKSSLIEYPDAGHGLIYQYPIDLAEHIESFLKEITDKR